MSECSTSSSSDSEFHNENSADLSYQHLDSIPESAVSRSNEILSLQLNNNEIQKLPTSISHFHKLVTLDVSSNGMKTLCDEICHLKHIRTFVAKNNRFSENSLPKDFGLLQSLEVVNLSGNHMVRFPHQVTELSKLKCLYMGSNQMREITGRIKHLTRYVDL